MSEDGPGMMWGGRFASPLDPTIRSFTGSLAFDRRLVREDLTASLAHAVALLESGVVSPDDGAAILEGLWEMLEEVEAGALAVEGEDEDVHSWIERTLRERIGDPAGRLHTGRSRNDQTSVALRLYTRRAIAGIVDSSLAFVKTLIDRAEPHLETWLPGYTHLQRGQPISLAHHLSAHAWSLLADCARLRGVHRNAGVSPLGAGALAGGPFPIDPRRTAGLLGLDRVFPNSVLAVTDRDYVAETVFACALLLLHLSRWAGELVLWSGSEFGFVSLGDAVAQGSSLMPQKKNPEAAELLRGKSARAIGNVAAILTLLKGLPFAYNSDLQEDKAPLFDSLDTTEDSLACAEVLARGIEYRPDRMREALRGGMVTATALADHLVRRGTAFRTAHEQAGRAVREAEARDLELWELPLEALRRCCPGVGEEVRQAIRPEAAVRAHASPGGPAPERVGEQLEAARAELRSHREWLESLGPPPVLRHVRTLAGSRG